MVFRLRVKLDFKMNFLIKIKFGGFSNGSYCNKLERLEKHLLSLSRYKIYNIEPNIMGTNFFFGFKAAKFNDPKISFNDW